VRYDDEDEPLSPEEKIKSVITGFAEKIKAKFKPKK
jgi:hypothetical protein